MKKKIFATVCMCGIVLSSFGGPVTVFATNHDQLIEQKNNEIDQLRQQRQSVQGEIDGLSAEIDSLNQEAAIILAQQSDLLQEIEGLDQEISQLEERIAKRSENIEKQARETQINGKGDHFLTAVLEAESVSDLVGRVHAMTTIIRANNEVIEQQKADQKAVEEKRAESQEKVAELQAAQSHLEAQKGVLEATQAELNVLVSNLAYEEATKEEEKEQLRAEKEAYEAEQARIREEAARVAALQAQAEQAAQQQAEQAAAEEAALNEAAAQADSTELEIGAESQEPVEEPEAPVETQPEETQGSESVETPEAPEETPVDAPEIQEPETPTIPAAPETPADSAPVTPAPTPVTPAPAPTPAPTPIVTPPTAPSAPASTNGAAIVAEAYKHIGKPYVWGAKGPDSFDCSGFTRYVFLQVTGRDIGGWTVPQETAGTVIPVSQAQPGDLLFWGSSGSTYHVAIALGGGQYIHAPRPGQNVSVGSTAYFTPSFAVKM